MAIHDHTGRASGIELRLAALAKAYELKQLLERVVECPEYGPGSCPASALERLDDVLASLRPAPPDDEEDEDDPGAPRWLLEAIAAVRP